MRTSQALSNLFSPASPGGALLLFCTLAATSPALGQPRLLEGNHDPEVAARGFTGAAACSESACLELNPAFLHSEDEYVRPYFAIGTRFNEALFDTVDKWEDTKTVFQSDRYRAIFLKTWNLVSRQTAKVDLEFGLRLGAFSFSYSPVSFGAVFFVHDPVLPFGELYSYGTTTMRAGYAYVVPVTSQKVKSLTVGASLKHTSAIAKRFVFNQGNDQFDEAESPEGTWILGRLGATAVLGTQRHVALSAVISGIPVYGKPLENMPHTDFFDVQPGASVEIARTWWGDIQAYYSLARLTRNESIWLKQHLGLTGTIGKFVTSIGVSDAMLTQGLSLALPWAKFSFATYGVEYSEVAHNMTDRVYWFRIEI